MYLFHCTARTNDNNAHTEEEQRRRSGGEAEEEEKGEGREETRIITLNPCQDVSADLLDRFQLSAAQCIGRNMRLLSGPGTHTQALAELMQAVGTGKRARAVLVLYSCLAGESFWVSAQPCFSACGELVSALLELEPCKALTLKTAAQDDGQAKAIVEASQPFRATFCSPEFEALYGLAAPMVLGRTLNLIHGPTTDQGAWRRLLAAAVEGAQGSAQIVTATCDCREIEVMV